MMVGALGKEWRLREWYEVDFEEEASDWPQQFEFVYVPDTRSDEERRNDLTRETTAAINLALSEISRLLEQYCNSP
jgi:hypothetical protein